MKVIDIEKIIQYSSYFYDEGNCFFFFQIGSCSCKVRKALFKYAS